MAKKNVIQLPAEQLKQPSTVQQSADGNIHYRTLLLSGFEMV